MPSAGRMRLAVALGKKTLLSATVVSAATALTIYHMLLPILRFAASSKKHNTAL
jgi:hypothetical protein